ncbi:MAG: heparinase II/III family protein [Clostridia bacterium]|nr:heparinase II/III family protein [Clostridia bacterium]
MEYRYKKDFPNGLKDVLLPREDFHPLPKYEDEAAWQQVSDATRAMILAKAEELLVTPMPRVTATAYMQFFRTGSRAFDESIDHPRRYALFWLTAAECLERKGRFMDQLIDYIWDICETTSWILPAHNWHGLEGGWGNDSPRPLADIKDPHIDLFVAATGEYLAWVLYIMRSKLDEVSFLISERIEYELNRRVIEPFCNRRDAWWIDDSTHNWHIWITSNCLTIILLTESNPAKRAKAAELALRYVEDFYRKYMEDGSTNEGAAYWIAAAGSMCHALKTFKLASNGAIDHFDEPMVHNIAAFLYHLHINEQAFYNYGYTPRLVTGLQGMELYDFGRLLNDTAMMELGAYMYHLNKQPLVISAHGDNAYMPFFEILHGHELEAMEPKAPNIGYCYSSAQQLMIAREKPGTTEGLFLGAKGFNGHFDSHRDGGSFIVYNNSKPVYIEIGVPVYSIKVIGAKYRHSHFACVPQSHNAISVNGFGQIPGTLTGSMNNEKLHSPAAKAISSRSTSNDDGNAAILTVEMPHLFPTESGVKEFARTFTMDRSAGMVSVRQQVTCENESEICLHFITCEKPEIADGIVVGGTKLTYDTALFTANVEKFDYENDVKVNAAWGDEIYSVTLTAHAKELDSTFTISKIAP